MFPYSLAIFLIISTARAQYSEQPKKEDTTDYRSMSILFSVEDTTAKKTVWLERTQDLDYFLRYKDKDGEEVKKLASKEGARIDRDFAARFLKCQYELPAAPGACEVTLRLKMKGEDQDICKKDEKKSQEIAVFVSELVKRF